MKFSDLLIGGALVGGALFLIGRTKTSASTPEGGDNPLSFLSKFTMPNLFKGNPLSFLGDIPNLLFNPLAIPEAVAGGFAGGAADAVGGVADTAASGLSAIAQQANDLLQSIVNGAPIQLLQKKLQDSAGTPEHDTWWDTWNRWVFNKDLPPVTDFHPQRVLSPANDLNNIITGSTFPNAQGVVNIPKTAGGNVDTVTGDAWKKIETEAALAGFNPATGYSDLQGNIHFQPATGASGATAVIHALQDQSNIPFFYRRFD